MKEALSTISKHTTQSTSGLTQSIISVAGNGASMTVSAVAMLLLSRSLGPIDFGVFSVGFALVLILNKINDLGLTLAQLKFIPRMSSAQDQNEVFSYVIKLKLSVTVAIAILGTLFTPTLSGLLDFPHTNILYLAFWLNGLTVLFEQLMVMLQALHRFTAAAISGVIQASGKFITAILVVLFFPKNILLAFITYVSAPILPVLFLKYLLPKTVILTRNSKKTTDHKKIISMAGHSAVGFMALGIIENIDILFVQRYLNDFETGLLGGAGKIAMLFSLSAFALSTVLNARAARYHKKSDLRNFIRKGILLALATSIGYAILAPLSGLLITLSIGPEYAAAQTLLKILLGASFLTIITTPFTAIFFSFKGAEWYFSAGGVLQLLLIVIGNAVLVPQFGLLASAWTRVATKALYLLFTLVVATYYVRSIHSEKTE